MLKNVAPLGFNPAHHGKKPRKGNPLVAWLAEQEGTARPKTAPPLRPSKTTENLGAGTLKVVTESFYTTDVVPLVERFLQRCFLDKPQHVVAYASAHFVGAESAASALRVSKQVTWPQYEKAYVQPARLFLIQPLVHLLLQARPANAEAYVKRVFAVYETLLKEGFDGQYPIGDVPMKDFAQVLTDVLWSVDDNEMKLLNGVLQGLQREDGTVRLIEFAIRVPLEISEKLSHALVHGPPAEDEHGDGNSEEKVDASGAAAADDIAFDDEHSRAEARTQQVLEELEDVVKAARLATALPRRTDEERADEFPEAEREALQLRQLVQQLSEMEPHRRDWVEDELPQLHANLKLLTSLPPRTRVDDSDDEDEDLQNENRALRDIVERGANVCEVLLAGLGPTIERKSAGSHVDEYLVSARLLTSLPSTDLSEIEEDYPEIVREILQLRGFVERLAEAQPERGDWTRCV